MSNDSRFFSGLHDSLASIWQKRELLHLLVRREVRAKYKDSVLGLVWSTARPLMQLVIYYFVIGKFLGAARSIPSFAIYVYAGLAIWSLFNDIVIGGTGSILSNSGIIKKVKLPGEIFPLAGVGAALFNFAIQLGILIVAILIMRQPTTPIHWLYLPLAILLVLVWATALALLFSAANVYLRDIQYLVEVILMVMFWASPVVYSWAQVAPMVSKALQELYLLNPVTLSIMGMHDAMWSMGDASHYPSHLVMRMLIATAVGLVALLIAQRVFSRMQGNFAQEI